MHLPRRSFLFALGATMLALPMVVSGPAFAQASAMPPVDYVQTNGIRMAVYEAGTGPTVVLLHGFPELAYSWHNQIPALVEAGYRVIVPDLRGYGLTERPAAVTDYDLAHLTGDLVGLLDALEVKKAVWMGHDWGGLLAWQMSLFHEDRTAGVISVGTPFVPHWQYWLQPDQIDGLAPEGFVPSPQIDPVAQMQQVYSPSMYVLLMQDGDAADRLLELDVERSFRSMLRKNFVAPADYFALPAEYRQMDFLPPLGLPETDMLGDDVLTAGELAVFTAAFEETGFTPATNWYRNLKRNWEAGLDVDQTVRVPSLMISAETDVVFTPGMAEGMGAYVADLETVVIEGAGHWILQEKPEDLNTIAIDWLERRFPQ